MPAPRVHGGPDAHGVALYDFSTNSNACGPCPSALAAVQGADATRYPDPQYTALRQQLAAFHGVDVGRVLLAASASAFIHGISAWVARSGGSAVCLPQHHYGDYLQAAQAWGLPVGAAENARSARLARLVWACEPSSPLGQAHTGLVDQVAALHAGQQLVLDCAYAPLRLSGTASLGASLLDRVWQLWTPNKALGLTGIRGAYAIAPAGAEEVAQALVALSPSWPVGTHGVALLQAWCSPASQHWLAQSLPTLRRWKARQQAVCVSLGWPCLPSDSNFFVARPAVVDLVHSLRQWRAQGVQLRDAASFGLPGHVRLGVLPPGAQDALADACLRCP